MQSRVFYTYAYLRVDGTPYYIGKGKDRRAWAKHKKWLPRPKDNSRILILKEGLTEEEAFRHEIYMINVFGRKDLGTGILHNRTNGGEGVSGKIVPRGVREKISRGHKKRSAEEKAKTSTLLSKLHQDRSPEYREQIAKKKSRTMKKTVQSFSDEKKSEISSKKVKGFKLSLQNRTPEKREEVSANLRAAALKREQRRTPEEREQIKKKKKETWEKKSLEPRQFQCTITGFISSTPQGLTKYQKSRGIDPSNRVRIE
jgi:phage-related minor tail protein